MAPVWQQCLTNWCSSHERCDWLERPRKAGLWKEVFLWCWWFGLIMNKVYFYSVNVPQKSFHLRHHDLWPAPLTLIIKDCIQTMDRGRSCTSCLPVKSFKWCNKAKTSLSVTYLLPWLLSPRVSSSPPLFASSEGGSRTRGEEVREGNFGRSVCEEEQRLNHIWFWSIFLQRFICDVSACRSPGRALLLLWGLKASLSSDLFLCF